MLKILSMLIPFFKEMIFGKKGESINDTLTTKTKKWLLLIIVISSLLFNYVLGKRVYVLSIHDLTIQKQLVVLKDIKAELETEKQKNFIIQDYLQSCYRNGKKYIPEIKNNAKPSSVE